jgi:hypothetical protein
MRSLALGSLAAPLLFGLLAMRAVACEGSAFTLAQSSAPVPTPPVPDAASDAPATVSAAQACGDSAHARCSLIAKCSPAILSNTYVNEATCETRLKVNCLDQLAAPGTGATAETTEACAVALPSETCDQLLDDQPVAACAQKTGSMSIGEMCAFPGQCQTGFCAIQPGAACGTCQNAPQPGDSCARLTTCGDLLTCLTTVDLCESFSTTSCGPTQPCGAGLSCVGATSSAPGTCEAAVETAGNVCDPTQKKGPACDRNALLTCSSSKNSCVALALVSAGAPCGVVNGASVLCAAAGTCVTTAADAGPDGGDAGTVSNCQAAATDGLPCDLTKGPYCIAPARCIVTGGGTSGTCAFVDPTKCQ